MGEAAAEEGRSAGCSFSSLMCLEDGADLDAGGGSAAESADDGAFLCSDAGEEDQEEYMDHLVSKETSFFCCSPSSSSSPVFADTGTEPPCPSSAAASDEWSRCARRATVAWIFETRAYLGFSHRTAYLAVSYMDRFCLRRCMDASATPWAARLLAVACVSLAAKMEEYRAPALPEFFRDGDGYDFCSASVRRMELLVLSTLGWRMGDVTPLDYLLCLCSRLRRANGGGGVVAAKAAALIFSAAEAGSVLDYRPSSVAVAAVLAAAFRGAMAKEALEARMRSLSPSCLLDKDDVHACYSTMLGSSSSSATPGTLAAAKRPPPPSSGGSTSTTHDESVDAASSFADSNNNKRARLELPLPAGAVGP